MYRYYHWLLCCIRMECSNGYVQVDVDDPIATIVIDGEIDANAINLSLAHDFR